MQKFVFFIVCCMLLITGCSDKYFSSNIDLTETTDQIDTETSTELTEYISMTTVTDEQYLMDNTADEKACSAILKELPPVMKGKWLVGEVFGLIAVGRRGEESQGYIIEFSDESIKVNGEALQNPVISQDVAWDYDWLMSYKWNVWKIGMKKGDYARYIVIKGRLDSIDSEYFIPILYFDDNPYLMKSNGYYMEKLDDNSKEISGADEKACSAILKELPPVMEGKWLVGEELDLDLDTTAVRDEDRKGNIIEFSAKSIRVNDEALKHPVISRDEMLSYDWLRCVEYWDVQKIGMKTEDYARSIIIRGWMNSTDSEYSIPILYFNEKPYLMNGCGYYMEKLNDNGYETAVTTKQLLPK